MDKAVAVALSILSLLYIVFALTIHPRVIPGLATPGPGPRAVPLVIGLLMLGLSVSLSIQAFRDPQARRSAEAPTGLVLVTIAASILLVVVFRSVGFIITSSALLFVLIFLGRMRGVKLASLPWLAAGLLPSTGLAIGLSWTSNSLILALVHYGRANGIAFLSSRFFGAVCILALTAALTIALLFLLQRFTHRRFVGDIIMASLASVCATQSLYAIFVHIFLVGLPSGVLSF